MPETTIEVRWPDGSVRAYYSPSLVVTENLEPGREYAVAEFVDRCRTSLEIASERVRAKYGFPCGRAAASLAGIERDAREVVGTVTVVGFR